MRTKTSVVGVGMIVSLKIIRENLLGRACVYSALCDTAVSKAGAQALLTTLTHLGYTIDKKRDEA